AAAIMSSAVKHFSDLVDAALKSDHPVDGPLHTNLLDMALAINDRDATARLLAPVLAGPQIETLGHFVETVRRRGRTLKQLADARPGDALSVRLAEVPKAVEAARALLADASAPPGRRAAAAVLIGWN